MSVWIQAARAGRAVTRSSLIPAINLRAVYLSLLILAGALSLLYLNQTSDLASASYDVTALQNEKRLWEIRNEQLRLRIAELESLDRIDHEASTRLKMGPPRKIVYTIGSDLAPLPASEPAQSGASSGAPDVETPLARFRERIDTLYRGVLGGG